MVSFYTRLITEDSGYDEIKLGLSDFLFTLAQRCSTAGNLQLHVTIQFAARNLRS